LRRIRIRTVGLQALMRQELQDIWQGLSLA